MVPYRSASRQMLVWMLICFRGLGGMFAALWSFQEWEAWAFVPAFLVFLSSLVIGWKVTSSLKKARFRKIGGRLLPMGYEFVEGPSEGLKEEFFMPFAPMAGWMNLQRGAAGLEWIAMLPEGDEAMRLFEYEFTTGSGRSTQIHMYTLAGWPAVGTAVKGAALGHLAGFRAFPARWGQRRLWRKQALKMPEFDRSLPGWIFTGDEGTGRRFLTDDVVRELHAAPKGESWFIGGGWVCCLYENPLDPENLLRFIDRARRVYSSAG